MAPFRLHITLSISLLLLGLIRGCAAAGGSEFDIAIAQPGRDDDPVYRWRTEELKQAGEEARKHLAALDEDVDTAIRRKRRDGDQARLPSSIVGGFGHDPSLSSIRKNVDRVKNQQIVINEIAAPPNPNWLARSMPGTGHIQVTTDFYNHPKDIQGRLLVHEAVHSHGKNTGHDHLLLVGHHGDGRKILQPVGPGMLAAHPQLKPWTAAGYYWNKAGYELIRKEGSRQSHYLADPYAVAAHKAAWNKGLIRTPQNNLEVERTTALTTGVHSPSDPAALRARTHPHTQQLSLRPDTAPINRHEDIRHPPRIDHGTNPLSPVPGQPQQLPFPTTGGTPPGQHQRLDRPLPPLPVNDPSHRHPSQGPSRRQTYSTGYGSTDHHQGRPSTSSGWGPTHVQNRPVIPVDTRIQRPSTSSQMGQNPWYPDHQRRPSLSGWGVPVPPQQNRPVIPVDTRVHHPSTSSHHPQYPQRQHTISGYGAPQQNDARRHPSTASIVAHWGSLVQNPATTTAHRPTHRPLGRVRSQSFDGSQLPSWQHNLAHTRPVIPVIPGVTVPGPGQGPRPSTSSHRPPRVSQSNHGHTSTGPVASGSTHHTQTGGGRPAKPSFFGKVKNALTFTKKDKSKRS